MAGVNILGRCGNFLDPYELVIQQGFDISWSVELESNNAGITRVATAHGNWSFTRVEYVGQLANTLGDYQFAFYRNGCCGTIVQMLIQDNPDNKWTNYNYFIDRTSSGPYCSRTLTEDNWNNAPLIMPFTLNLETNQMSNFSVISPGAIIGCQCAAAPTNLTSKAVVNSIIGVDMANKAMGTGGTETASGPFNATSGGIPCNSVNPISGTITLNFSWT